jgi:hypothetical protein
MAEPWYIQQRAESLAMILLTRESGVRVLREPGLDFGLDFKLFLDPDHADEWLGVELRAVASDPPATMRWDRPGLASRYFQRLNLPLLLLVVNGKADDHCFFAWIKEPVVDNGESQLRSHLAEEELLLAALDPVVYREVLAQSRAFFAVMHNASVAVP